MVHQSADSRLRFWAILAGLAVPIAFLTVLAFFARLWWVAELATHFRLQYAFCATLLAVGVALSRKYLVTVAILALAALNAAFVLPLYVGRQPSAPGPELRCLLLNVNTSSREYDRVAAIVKEGAADIVALLEVNGEWRERLSRLVDSTYYTFWEPRPDNFGIALLTRLVPIGSGTHYFGSGGVPSIACTLATAELPLVVLATHPLPPRNTEYARGRNTQLGAIGDWATRQTMPVLVVGDLNATPFSPQFRGLLTRSGLRNSQKGFGFQGTWPSSSPVLRIPIDHILHSRRFHVSSRRIGPNTGSDHLAVLATLDLQAMPVQPPGAGDQRLK